MPHRVVKQRFIAWLCGIGVLVSTSALAHAVTELVVTPSEAEEAALEGAVVDTIHPGYTGTGFVDFVGEGSMTWTVEVPVTALYQLSFRYALGVNQDRPLDILGDNGILISAAVAFPFTERWENWQTVSVFTKLEAGTRTIRAVTTGQSGPNIDHVLVSLTPPDANQFLTFPLHTSHAVFAGSEDSANAYYQVIDPSGRRTTFEDWKAVNSMALFDPEDPQSAHAVYLNNVDLSFGRSMFVKRRANGDVASYVQNYLTLEDALNGTNLLATVAMEYRAPEDDPNAPKFTTFYVFNQDGQRINKINLDGRGEKYVPNLCNTCHGGKPKLGGFHGDTAT